MIWHIATMVNGKGYETDVYWNELTHEVYQAEHPSVIDEELFTAIGVPEAEEELQARYGTNVELD